MIRINAGLSAFLNGLLLLLVSVQIHAINLPNPETVLETYVNHDDGAFNIQHIVSVPGSGYTAHLSFLREKPCRLGRGWIVQGAVASKLVRCILLLNILPLLV